MPFTPTLINITNPALGVINILKDTQGLPITGWTLAAGDLTDTPDKQLTARNSGGPSGEVAVAIDYPSVQLLCRGTTGAGYAEAYALLEKCRQSLVGIPTGGTVYPELTGIICQGHIVQLMRDDKARPQFSLNLRLTVSYDTSGYREL
jgi:hypothetical protein